MAFRNVEDKINALRHIVGAEKIAEENKDKDQTIAKLKTEMKHQNEIHLKELQQKDKILMGLTFELEQANQRNITYNKKNYSPVAFEALIDSRFSEKTERKIKTRVQRLFNANIDNLVRKEIAKYPNCRNDTTRVIETQVAQKIDTILYNKANWPPRFHNYLSVEARKEATRLKNNDYYMEVDQGAAKRLEELKNGAWRRYIDNYKASSLTPFLQNSIRQQIISLQEVFEVNCPKCGNVITFQLTNDNLSGLVNDRPAKITCMYCKGFWGPTTFPINLGQVFWALTTGISNKK